MINLKEQCNNNMLCIMLLLLVESYIILLFLCDSECEDFHNIIFVGPFYKKIILHKITYRDCGINEKSLDNYSQKPLRNCNLLGLFYLIVFFTS